LREEVAIIDRVEEKRKKLAPYLSDPKVLARLLCAISSINYSYQEWKKTVIWGANRRNKYEEVYDLVLELLADRSFSEYDQRLIKVNRSGIVRYHKPHCKAITHNKLLLMMRMVRLLTKSE
jgi:hypothetical protein